jgi:thiamine-monophosphate kinase
LKQAQQLRPEAMPEFDLIGSLQQKICLPADEAVAGCSIGIGDDCAVFEVPSGHELLVCTDTLVEGVHFPRATRPEAIGHKALAVNLSDLAAMGAQPAFFLMALTLPSANPAWLESFSQGMARLARQSRIQLSGGDTTSGPLSITVTALGLVEKGRALLRSGASPGDLVVISGRPGAAANALGAIQRGLEPESSDNKALAFPVPRLALGRALVGLATSCIDLSDGLAADLGHILEQSGVGAVIELKLLPCPDSLAKQTGEQRWPVQLAGGDDYELCFTIPPDESSQLAAIARSSGVELTIIGAIVESPGLVLKTPGGLQFEPVSSGYQHFACGEENS